MNAWTPKGWCLPWLPREGQEVLGLWTMASWDMVAQRWDNGTNCPRTRQNQILGALAWPSLLHRLSGIFLESPELCCILGWVSVCGGTLKHPLGLVWPWAGGSRQCPPRACHAPSTALSPASPKAVPAASTGGDCHLLEQLFGASARRAAVDGNS